MPVLHRDTHNIYGIAIAMLATLQEFQNLCFSEHPSVHGKWWWCILPSSIIQNFPGDGTEDISCRMDPGCLTPNPSSTGVFTKDQAAAFYEDLKLHFIGFLVYPIVFLKNPNFPLKIGQVPPMMDPMISGDVLYDTEYEVGGGNNV